MLGKQSKESRRRGRGRLTDLEGHPSWAPTSTSRLHFAFFYHRLPPSAAASRIQARKHPLAISPPTTRLSGMSAVDSTPENIKAQAAAAAR